MRPSLTILIFASVSFLLFQKAYAFPEMIRHGYVNCTSCHVSPTGGGILNEYGRELSKEVLSTWTSTAEDNKEHLFAYGLINPKKWLNLGGDAKSVFVYKNDEFASQGRLILMQADLEAAAQFNKWTFDATFGYDNPKTVKTWRDHIALHRHYLMYQLTEESSIRAGKYIPAFGINTPDHVTLTRRGIGMGQGFEAYNLEYSWLGSIFSLQGSLIFGRPDDKSLQREQGASLLSGIALGEKTKIGLSYLYGNNDNYWRHLFGPFGMIGFTEKCTLLTEFDFQAKHFTSSLNQFGAFTTQKLSYELAKGVWAYGVQEWGKSDFSSNSKTETYGLGVQFFPRPHFELNVAYETQLISDVSSQFFDYAWIMTHFYM